MRPLRQLAAAAARRFLSPMVPARTRLPFAYWVRVLSGECGPDLTRVERFFAGTGVAIDIGANEGLFTYRFSKFFRSVHAFEINPDLATPISQYNPGNITLYPCGLSSSARKAKLLIPIAHGLAVAGWGSLEPTSLPRSEQLIEKDVQVKALDDFGIIGVDFIKIDVEGHELEVLKGARGTIEASRPVLLIEVKGENLPVAKAWFQEIGFCHCSLDELFELREKQHNHIFAPREKLKELSIPSQ